MKPNRNEIKPGTRVLNGRPEYQVTGTVVENLADPEGAIWVEWDAANAAGFRCPLPYSFERNFLDGRITVLE